MKLIKPYVEIISKNSPIEDMRLMEKIGRTSYKSEGDITKYSHLEFLNMIRSRDHLGIFEHITVSVKVVCDRGISHEIVRHRLASYVQESSRYCNYSKDKFDNQITYIIPSWSNLEENENIHFPNGKEMNKSGKLSQNDFKFIEILTFCEDAYFNLLENGWKPEQARAVLPNALKTEIMITMNLREWLLFFSLRTKMAAHPQMRQWTVPLYNFFKYNYNPIFRSLNIPLDAKKNIVSYAKIINNASKKEE